jgi:thiamine pyrophosphate-dependent acetolactate synthase large subunit-like protein
MSNGELGQPADPRNGSELNWVLNVAQKVMGAVNVDSTEKLAREFTTALDADGPTVIVVATKPQPAHLG